MTGSIHRASSTPPFMRDGSGDAPSDPVGVVVATRNRRESVLRTLGHLAALPEQPPIVVVDNASGDGTAEAVALGHPEVELVRLTRNRGAFARNLGLARLSTPYVALCDDDSWYALGALARAVTVFDRHPQLGLIAARILVGPDRSLDPASAAMRGRAAPGMPGPRVHGFLACGAIARRAAFLEIGGFCERFLIGGEERLAAIDLAAAGWDLAYCDDVVAIHEPHDTGRGGRSTLVVRNDLWTSWLRLPAARALADTGRVAAAAATEQTDRRALLGALAGLPGVLAHRRRAPGWLVRQRDAAGAR
jgi:GT2 family glycosyltransferase